MDFNTFIKEYPIKLNKQQEAAVQAVNGPTLLLAVPGSGKTTVLTARIGYMVKCCGINPRNILTVTYTTSATKDMKERARKMFGDEIADSVEYRTINGICAKILYFYGQNVAPVPYKLVDESVITGVLTRIYQHVEKSYPDESEIMGVRTKITYAKNMMLNSEELKALNEKADCEFDKIFELYKSVMKQNGMMDYDDQMVYALNILRMFPNILQYYQNLYQYICVDESQDTSKIQHEIIRLLAGGRNLFMVGDEDQSIYGFRAAYPEALLSFEKQYENAKVLLMEENYRSNANIVNVADGFIQKNTLRHKKTMKPTREVGSQITKVMTKGRKEQFEKLLEVARNCTTETAVLYRNNESSIPLIDVLERNNISYRVKNAELTFFSHKIVKDVTSIIAFSNNFHDTDAFMNIYYKLNLYMKKADAQMIAKTVKMTGKDVFTVVDELKLNDGLVMKLLRLKGQLIRLKKSKGSQIMRVILDDIGYGEYLENANIKDNKTFILKDISSRIESPADLVNRLGELKTIIETKKNDYSCPFILSTIHSSKGLEYDTVYLIDVEDETFPEQVITNPKYATKEELTAYEEERRLFYVAITRAKNHLFIVNNGARSTFQNQLFDVTKTISAPANEPVKEPFIKMKSYTEFYNQLGEGMMITHTTYGDGVITNMDNQKIYILFGSEEKIFSLKFLWEKDMLRF